MAITRITPADFDSLAADADGLLKLIGGEVVGVPSTTYTAKPSMLRRFQGHRGELPRE